MDKDISNFITQITTSNIISKSIINRQSLISKIFRRYLHSPGSHQSTRFLESVSDSVSNPGSIASHDAKNHVILEKSSLVIFAIMLVTLSTSILVTSSATLSTSMTSTPITISNIISMSIINRQSLIGKVYSRYLHSPGSHQSTRFLESLSDSVTE